MAEKLTFDEIKALYDEEWVELVDYDWPEGTPWPQAGIVRVHHPNRSEFWKLSKATQPEVTDSAIVFIGPPDPPGVIRNNLATMTLCKK